MTLKKCEIFFLLHGNSKVSKSPVHQVFRATTLRWRDSLFQFSTYHVFIETTPFSRSHKQTLVSFPHALSNGLIAKHLYSVFLNPSE
jgi:hypothetical protein